MTKRKSDPWAEHKADALASIVVMALVLMLAVGFVMDRVTAPRATPAPPEVLATPGAEPVETFRPPPPVYPDEFGGVFYGCWGGTTDEVAAYGPEHPKLAGKFHCVNGFPITDRPLAPN